MENKRECKPKKIQRNVIVGFRITQSDRERLDLILNKRGTTISRYFRESVESLLKSAKAMER